MASDLGSVFNRTAKAARFTRQGQCWVRTVSWGAILLSLQASQYGLAPYVNLGLVWTNLHLGQPPIRRVQEADMYGRLERISPEAASLVVEITQTSSEPGDDRILVWARRLSSEIERLGSDAGIRSAWASGALSHFISTTGARQYLGASD